MDITIKAEYICRKVGIYSNYVFKNLDDNTYIMCTVLPNWDISEFQSGDIGFLTYEYAEAGQPYINSNLEEGRYRFTKNYFKDFVKEVKETNLVL